MNRRGFILTISTFMYVAIFILFLSLTSFVIYKSTMTDKQVFQPYLDFVKFNTGQTNNDLSGQFYWCSKFFYYDALNPADGYNYIVEKRYCEGYNAKRFV